MSDLVNKIIKVSLLTLWPWWNPTIKFNSVLAGSLRKQKYNIQHDARSWVMWVGGLISERISCFIYQPFTFYLFN